MNPGEAAAKGRTLLDRPLPQDYREQWTGLLSLPEAPKAAKAETLLLFQIGALGLALPMARLAGVVPLPKISRIPHRRDTALLGLVAVQGSILPCCSLAHLLDTDPSLEEQARLLLLEERPGRLWAAPVRAVDGLGLRPETLQPPASELPEGWSLGRVPGRKGAYDLLNPETLFRQINLATA